MRADKLNRRKATNWVVIKYSEAKSSLASELQNSRKRPKLPKGTRADLVARAITKFNIKGEFTVPCQTIQSRMNADRLVVWQPDSSSPVLMVEVTLHAYIIQAWMLNCPLSVSKYIELMNDLISGTRYEAALI